MQKTNSFIVVLTMVAASIVAWCVQFSQPSIIGADGFFHGRVSIMVRENGFLSTFPQAYYSWFTTRFSDKDFVYHVFLIPFTGVFGFLTGTKVGAAVATTLVYWSIILIAFRCFRHWSVFFLVSLFLLSGQFVRYTAEARPFVLAIAFTCWGIYWAITNKRLWVFIFSLVYGMTHISSWTLPFFILVWTLVKTTVLRQKHSWSMVLLSIVGYLLSFLFHPNFPNNLYYFYLNGILVPLFAAQGGVLELGAEFFPLTTRDLLYRFPILLAGGAYICFAVLIVSPLFHLETVGWGVAAICYGILSLFSAKTMVHAYPVILLFFTSAIGDVWRGIKQRGRKDQERGYALSIMYWLIVGSIALYYTATTSTFMLRGDRIYSAHFQSVATIIRETVPKGERIFHANWSDSQFLIGLAPEYQYFVTLDPIYMYSYNPQLYALYRDVSFGRIKDPHDVLTRVFQVKYGYAAKTFFNTLVSEIRSDERFSILYEDDIGVFFMVKTSDVRG